MRKAEQIYGKFSYNSDELDIKGLKWKGKRGEVENGVIAHRIVTKGRAAISVVKLSGTNQRQICVCAYYNTDRHPLFCLCFCYSLVCRMDG